MGGLAAVVPVISAVASVAQAITGSSKPKAPAPAPAPVIQQDTPPPAKAPDFKPVKPTAMALPSSLSDLSNFSPDQQRSALATKGSQNGLGADEDAYYKNLVQRTLIGDDNTVTGSPNSLLPVDNQYLSKSGVNTSDVMELLRQIQGGTS